MISKRNELHFNRQGMDKRIRKTCFSINLNSPAISKYLCYMYFKS